MGIYLLGCTARVLRMGTRRGAALPRHGAPRRRRHRRGGRLLSRRPASVSGCRGAAHGCSWHSRSGGTAGEGKSWQEGSRWQLALTSRACMDLG